MRLTVWVISLTALGLGGYDLLIYKIIGNDATISRVMLGTQSTHPLFAVEFVWSLGVFCGHLFLPVLNSPLQPRRVVVTRVVGVLVPVVHVIASLISNTPDNGAGLYSNWLGVELSASFICGLVVGHKALSQHV